MKFALRSLAAFGLAAISLFGTEPVHAAKKYHFVTVKGYNPSTGTNGFFSVCVDPDLGKKILDSGDYGWKEWSQGQPIDGRGAAEMMPFTTNPALISVNCLEEFLAAFKKYYPDTELVFREIVY